MLLNINRDAGGEGFVIETPSHKLYAANLESVAKVLVTILADDSEPTPEVTARETGDPIDDAGLKILRFLRGCSYRPE